MVKQSRLILENLNDLGDDSIKELFTRLVAKMHNESKVSDKDMVVFVLDDGMMLGDVGSEHHAVMEWEIGNAVGDGLAIFVAEDDMHYDLTTFETTALTVIIPPAFEDDKFVMLDAVELTDEQTDTIEQLSTMGFKSVSIVLPYERGAR